MAYPRRMDFFKGIFMRSKDFFKGIFMGSRDFFKGIFMGVVPACTSLKKQTF